MGLEGVDLGIAGFFLSLKRPIALGLAPIFRRNSRLCQRFPLRPRVLHVLAIVILK